MPQKKNPDALELIRGKARQGLRRSHGTVHHREGSAAGLQQGHAGDAATGVRGGASRWRACCASRPASMPTVDVQLRAHAAGGEWRIHERAGGGCVSGAAGRAVPPGARSRSARRCSCASSKVANWSNCRRKTTRSAASTPTSSSTARWHSTEVWPCTTSREAQRRSAGARGLTDGERKTIPIL